jgi:hypothetical protein
LFFPIGKQQGDSSCDMRGGHAGTALVNRPVTTITSRCTDAFPWRGKVRFLPAITCWSIR